ncbi:MAG: PAS domain-containing protein [Chloroflexi bacterium]|nr:PAS domain-containing protein [Chloroflexota bacterium]
MNWQFSPYFVPYLVSAAVALGVIALTRPRRQIAAAPLVCLLMACTAWWALLNVAELASQELSHKVFWASLQYFAIPVIPPLWLMIALEYSGRRVSRRTLLVLAAVPLVTIVLVWTNGLHHWVWQNIHLAAANGYTVMAKTYGPWFWILTAWAYAQVLGGSVVLIGEALYGSASLYRRQTIVMLAAASIPLLGNISFVFHFSQELGLDLTPPAFALSGGLVVWALFRYRLLDLMPMAHETLFAEMRDGALVLDVHARVINLNPAAQRILRLTAKQAMGMAAQEALAERPNLAQQYRTVLDERTEIYLTHNGVSTPYDLLISPLVDRQGRPSGRLLVLRDITERKRTQAERERLIGELQQALADVKRLGGLLPICSVCKKIRDDQGYWREVEQYVTTHSEAGFSHSICPDCAQRLYKDYLKPG